MIWAIVSLGFEVTPAVLVAGLSLTWKCLSRHGRRLANGSHAGHGGDSSLPGKTRECTFSLLQKIKFLLMTECEFELWDAFGKDWILRADRRKGKLENAPLVCFKKSNFY